MLNRRYLDSIFCAFRELNRSRLRTLMVVAGYCITIALMVVTANLLLFSRYAENEILTTTGTNFVIYMPNCGDITTLTQQELADLARGIIPQKCLELCENCTGCNKKPYDLLNEGFIFDTNTTRLLSQDLVEEIKQLPAVKEATGYLMFRLRDPQSEHLFTLGGLRTGCEVIEASCCARSDVVAGEFINPAAVICCPETGLPLSNPDGSAVFAQAMLDVGFAANMGLKPGDTIVIASETLLVTGLVSTGVKPGHADVYVHFDDAERLINRRIQNPLYQEVNVILIDAHSPIVQQQAVDEVKQLVQSDAIVTYGCYETAAKALGLNQRSVWATMIITVLGAVFFSVKTQVSSMIERNRQIAVLKAIGWKNSSVILQVFAETTIQSVSGCVLGVILGVAMLFVLPVNQILGINAEVTMSLDPWLMAFVFAVAVAGGIASGLLPVIMVVRSRPSDVLRKVW